MARAFGVVVLLLFGCTNRAELVVNVRSDLLAGVELTGVEVELDEQRVSRIAAYGDDWLQPQRVAELEIEGDDDLVTAIVRAFGPLGVINSRTVRVSRTGGATAVTVVFTRDCRNVTCPAAGDSTSAVACLGGTCVSEDCSDGSQESCASECTGASDCGNESSCASPRCEGGLCLYFPRDDACAEGEYCDVEIGCRPLPEFNSSRTALAALPYGTVLAFDLDACPSGWGPLDGADSRMDARGRALVDVGPGPVNALRGQTGGAETVQLRGEHLPSGLVPVTGTMMLRTAVGAAITPLAEDSALASITSADVIFTSNAPGPTLGTGALVPDLRATFRPGEEATPVARRPSFLALLYCMKL